MKFVLSFFLLLFSLQVGANNLVFDRLTTENGLSSTQVTSIIQDKTGYLWIGTAEGLNRYDGYTFKIYHPETDNDRSIQSNYIDILFEDTQGRIWITFPTGEISYYNPIDDSFVNFTKDWLQQQLRVYGKILCFSSSSGDTWIGTENGLLVFDPASSSLKRFENTNSTVTTSPVNCIYKDKDQKIWLGTLSGFSLYDLTHKEFTDYTIQTSDKKPVNTDNLNGINCIYKDRSGCLWLGTGRQGVYCTLETDENLIFRQVGNNNTTVYQFLETSNGDFWIGHSMGASLINHANRKSLRIESFFNRPEDIAPIGECHVKFMQEDKNGTVWFVDNRFNQGQFYYSPITKQMEQLKHEIENPYSISSNQINCIYIDRFDNLWIGHSNYGLSRTRLDKPLFQYVFGYTKDNSNLLSNHVLSVYEDSDKHLWVASIKGLDRINYKTKKIDKRYVFSSTKAQNSLSGKIISSLVEDNERKLWVSYQDANPDRIDLNTFVIKPFYISSRIDYKNTIKNTAKLSKDKQGNIWISTSNMGLIQYSPHNSKTHYFTQPSFTNDKDFTFSNLYSLCIDSLNRIWIGSEGKGVRCFVVDKEEYNNYSHSALLPQSLVSDYVHTLFCDSEGDVWVGTNSGLDRFDNNTNTFEHFSIHDGLIGNVIESIQEPESGVLIISTNKGLSRFEKKSRTFFNYSTNNGLLTNEFTTDASCKLSTGELVYGTNKGIVSFDYKSIKKKNPSNNQNLRVSDVFLGEKKWNNDRLRISYQEAKDIRIEFLSLNYAYPLSTQYQYRLQNFDDNWRNTDAEHRFVEYTQLSSGRYVFQVRASVDGLNWSDSVSYSIIILAPWWQTWWFILLMCLLGIGVFVLIYKSRLRLYQIRQQELEAKIEDRTSLLQQAKQTLEEQNEELASLNGKLKSLDEQKTIFFTNISHELRTPLTIIKGLTENLEKQSNQLTDSQRKESIYTIRKNTHRLIRHVNELLDISMLEQGKLNPRISNSDMGVLLHEIVEMYISITSRYDIQFSYSISPELKNAFFDKNIIEQALFNLLSNALKYTRDGGRIHFNAILESKTNEDIVILTVEDTGIGISKENISSIFDRYFQNKNKPYQRFESSGIGLAHTKEIIESHFGSISCESTEGKGSVFRVMIPISESVFPKEWITKEVVRDNIGLYESDFKYLVGDDKPENYSSEKSTKQTILFVEDNEDLIKYLADSFSDSYKVVLAKDGEEGRRKAMEIIPDAIISDIMMPVVNGLELCEVLKTEERTAHIPIVLLTARVEETQQLEGYYVGADDYMLKPFNIDILKAKIKNLIKAKERLQERFKDTFNLNVPDINIPEKEQLFVTKATQVVLDNMQNPSFDVDVFCSEMAMSRANLFRKLKSATGFSASSFTRNIRIKYAAELLKKKGATVNEVAILTGFSDANYFSRCFKEIYGVIPSRYSEQVHVNNREAIE